MQTDYDKFLSKKRQLSGDFGFDPLWMPDFLYDFQQHLVEWSLRKGRAAIFADCGLGKTPMQLVWAENVVRKTDGKVLVLTPLAVAAQTEREASKFGIDCQQSNHGKVMPRITVTNYEQLHHFDPSDFAGVVCDESSILKNYSGATRNAIIGFADAIPYRLLCTATPSPNDYTELGNSVEALGIMRRVHMLATFFVHDSGDTGQWRLKGHGEDQFWRFVASWARALRRPSDLGFGDDRFKLPKLKIEQHTLKSQSDTTLFPMEARTLEEQRAERRATLDDRCGRVAELAKKNGSFVAWCGLNAESEIIAKLVPDAVELKGSQSNEEKEEIALGFADGKIRVLVTKPSICGFGMNWQHCADMSFFPSHSHEQYYQAVRRCWRFGQTKTVTTNIVTTEAESRVIDNMKKKEHASSVMFSRVVRHMREYYDRKPATYTPSTNLEVPSWL